MGFHRLDLPNQGIASLEGFQELREWKFLSVDLSRNAIRDFRFFGTHSYLVEVNLRYNKIDSFFGLTRQPSLEIIWLFGNPVADHPLYRIMILQTVGYSVRVIDSKAVSETEISLARRLGSQSALAVSCGWLLDLVPRSQFEYKAVIHQTTEERRHLASTPCDSGVPLYEAMNRCSAMSSRPNVLPTSIETCKGDLTNELKDAETPTNVAAIASSMEYDDGISISTNLHSDESVVGALRFSGPLCCATNFLRNRTLLEFDIRRTTLSGSGNSLTFSSCFGAEIYVRFASPAVANAVRHTFSIRKRAHLTQEGGPVIGDQRVQEEREVKRPSTSSTLKRSVSKSDSSKSDEVMVSAYRKRVGKPREESIVSKASVDHNSSLPHSVKEELTEKEPECPIVNPLPYDDANAMIPTLKTSPESASAVPHIPSIHSDSLPASTTTKGETQQHDDGGVQTPPPEHTKLSLDYSKFKDFVIDSDSD